jgi:uncharacterized membrane protein
MSDLYAIGYPNLLAAEQVVDTITELQARGMIDLEDAVIVERRGGDKVKLHQIGSGKAHWVGRIGHVFAGSGRSSGDAVIDAEFTRDLGAQLDAGNVALVMLVSSVVAEKVLDELHGQHSGHIMQTSLDQQSETALNEAAEQARESHRGLFN